MEKKKRQKENTINQKGPFFFTQEGEISCKILIYSDLNEIEGTYPTV